MILIPLKTPSWTFKEHDTLMVSKILAKGKAALTNSIPRPAFKIFNITVYGTLVLQVG